MIKREIKAFLCEEEGMGVVEVILIIVVLVAMVIIFREQITKLINTIWKAINWKAQKVYK